MSTWSQDLHQRWLGTGGSRGLRAYWDAHLAPVQVPNAHIVLAALGIAVVAQLLILQTLLVDGLVLYATAGIVLLLWMWRQNVSLFNLVSTAQMVVESNC